MRKFAKGRRKSGKKTIAQCRRDGAPVVEDNWLDVGTRDLRIAAGCPVDKETKSHSARRVTGGMQTFVLHCGLLVSFCELFRGESLQLVYAMLLRLVAKFKARGHDIQAIIYDNACKLLAVARAKRKCFPPLTELFAELPIILDALHRNNHVWCLENLPEVDCKRPENQRFTEGVDSQACEQHNTFVTDRTPPSLEMTGGRYLVWWNTLFCLKNARMLSERAKARARYARGHMKYDPDVVRQSQSTQG